MNFSISAVGNKNTASYTLEYKLQSASTWTALTSGSVYALNSSIISASGVFGVDNSFDVRLSVTDYFGTIRSTFEIPTAFTLLDFNASGRGVAFGKVSEMSEGVEFALPMRSGHGELINSPVHLKANQDLNSLLDTGYYIIGNTNVSATILNKPRGTLTESALVEVIAMGDDVQKLQRYSLCDKDDQYIWQRIYYSDTWGSWMLIGGCSGWKNLSMESTFSAYSSTTHPRYRVSGNLVTVSGAVSPKTAFMSSLVRTVFARGIPEAFRPDVAHSFICQGSDLNRWNLGVETDGTLTMSRYGKTENETVPTTAWLIFHCTYSI